jgi:selenocysteine lyase/cysteine desulfurase
MDWAATGLVPETGRKAIHRYVDELAACPSSESTWMYSRHGGTRNEARAIIARLMGADPKDIALVESTTAGLNAAAAAIRIPSGSNVVLSAVDYLAVSTPWKLRARRDGLELRWVEPRGPEILVEDILEQVDETTRVIALSTVCWTTGALLDVETLAREARMRGILLVVDAAQSFGVVPLDLRRSPAAFVACGGHKWLCSPLGAGFLYVNPETAARHQPPLVGFLSGRPQRGTWDVWFSDPAADPQEEILYPATGRAFETGGTPCHPGAIGLLESVKLLEAAGVERILEHVRDLGDRLIAGLDAKGYPVLTPRARSRRGGTIVFNVPGGIEREHALVARWRMERVVAGVRYCRGLGGVRVSLHGMNTVADVEKMLTVP